MKALVKEWEERKLMEVKELWRIREEKGSLDEIEEWKKEKLKVEIWLLRDLMSVEKLRKEK